MQYNMASCNLTASPTNEKKSLHPNARSIVSQIQSSRNVFPKCNEPTRQQTGFNAEYKPRGPTQSTSTVRFSQQAIPGEFSLGLTERLNRMKRRIHRNHRWLKRGPIKRYYIYFISLLFFNFFKFVKYEKTILK
jgi:hypothetical protein